MSEHTIVVTGANGCIGSWVLKLASERGHRIIATDIADRPTRPRLLLDDATLDGIEWQAVDISDTEAVRSLIVGRGVTGVVHLAGLQVPFCKADPVAGAKVNVVGTANVMEAVRAAGIKRFSSASSVAAHGSAAEGNPYLGSLYGAYKAAGEEMARVYWQDWQVPSVVIRPGVVYGIGRDQGMTSASTKAILAATIGRPYTIPYGGDAAFLYAAEVAGAFLKVAEHDREGAHVFDLSGQCRPVTDVARLIKREIPDADIRVEGEQLPFPPDISDDPILEYLGDYGQTTLEAGISETIARFRALRGSNTLDLGQLDR